MMPRSSLRPDFYTPAMSDLAAFMRKGRVALCQSTPRGEDFSRGAAHFRDAAGALLHGRPWKGIPCHAETSRATAI